jgi:hypothetical protein
MSQTDRERALLILGLLQTALVSFTSFAGVGTQFLLQNRGRKRLREEENATQQDEDLVLGAVTASLQEWPRSWTKVKSIHFVTCVLDGTLMADDDDEDFKKQFRLSRKSFDLLHDLLRIKSINNELN